MSPEKDNHVKKPCCDLADEKAALVCSAEGPYPACEDVEPCPEAVLLLLEDYASAKAELSAATTYMYQSALLRECYPKVSEALHCIGLVEMDHIGLLAALIVKLGGDPQYDSYDNAQRKYVYWSGAYADDAKLVLDMLYRDIAGEEYAIAQYEYHAKVIPIPCVKALLLRIAEDEKVHLCILKRLAHILQPC